MTAQRHEAPAEPPRVAATPAALRLLAEIQADHGEVMFHQSGGCCDGSSPMCYPRSDFQLADADVYLGSVGGAPVYIGAAQFDVWRHTQLVLDVVPGRGGMFSLDNGREQRFLTRSRVFTDQELARLGDGPEPTPFAGMSVAADSARPSVTDPASPEAGVPNLRGADSPSRPTTGPGHVVAGLRRALRAIWRELERGLELHP